MSTTRTRIENAPSNRAGSTDPARPISDGQRRLKACQPLPLAAIADPGVITLLSGCLKLDAVLAGEQRRTVMLLYPGDVLSRHSAPPLPFATISAAIASEIGILSAGRSAPMVATGAARLLARAALRAAAIAHLTAEQRFASYLIELALHLGHDAPGGRDRGLAKTRPQVAELIGVNPDTLSRLMSRMRSRGLLAMPTRARIIVPHMQQLLEMSPLADAQKAVAAAHMGAISK